MHMRLKYVVSDKDRHGNTRHYVRRPGHVKIRLHTPFGSAAFLEEYRAALVGNAKPVKPPRKSAPGTFGALVADYYQSAEFKQLAQTTQVVRRRILDKSRAVLHADPVAMFEPRHIRTMRDRRADKPAAANGWLKIIKVLFKWGVETGRMQSNPARDVPRVKVKSDGWHTWTEDEVRQFEKRHAEGTKPRLALALLLYTGVRRSDVVTLGRQMEQHGSIRFRQKKTGKWLTVPILQVLRTEIDRHKDDRLTYIVTAYNKPFTPAGFGGWFREQCDAAGLYECSAHGLRKAGATRAANNGASVHQLMAIYGWSSIKDAETYTKAADQERLAVSGITYLERTVDESVPLSGFQNAGGTKTGKKSK